MSFFPAGAEQPLTTLPDRRTGHRYEVSLEVRWKVSRRKRLLEAGRGTTIDVSSGGVLFEADRKIPTEGYVELFISWPALLNNSLPMQLVVTGRVVRVSGDRVAVQMLQHEFRTSGAATSAKSA
jgi:hypothetical protein